MEVVEFDAVKFEATSILFPDDIEQDSWICFHGTSGQFASSIEGQGLRIAKDFFTNSDLTRICDVFKALHWAGQHGGGYGVLSAYSMPDYDNVGNKAICLCRYAPTCLNYATREYAGGETVRAIRHAIRDLELYLNDPGVRDQHFAYLEFERAELRRLNAMPEPCKVPASLDWLSQQLSNLQDLKQRSADPGHRHTYGIVYAVRLVAADLAELTMDRGCPLELRANFVPSCRIEAKIEIPSEYIPRVAGVGPAYMARLNEFRNPDSLLFGMKQKSA